MSLAEVQNKITMDTLQELAGAYAVAKRAYYAAPDIQGLDVAADLEKKRLDAALDKALAAYHAALTKYQAQNK